MQMRSVIITGWFGRRTMLSANSILSSAAPPDASYGARIAASASSCSPLVRDLRREQLGAPLAIEIEIRKARGVARAAGVKRELVQPAQLMADALVPARLRNQCDCRSEHAAAQRFRDLAVMRGVQVAVVAVVAAEQLVAAVAADHDLDVASREARQQPRAQRERIGRLVERRDQVRQQRSDLGRDALFVMLGAEHLRHGARRRRFVEALIVQAHRERRQLADAELAREHRDQQARIHAAAEERTHRHVADQVQAQRLFDTRLELVAQLLFRARQFRFLLQAPVALDARRAARFERPANGRAAACGCLRTSTAAHRSGAARGTDRAPRGSCAAAVRRERAAP